MAGIYKRENVYYADLRVNGRRVRKRLGKNKRLAELALKDLELQAKRNQLGFLDQKEAKIETFFQNYLEYSKTNHREATTVRYRSAMKNVLDFLHDHPEVSELRDITPEILEKYKAHRRTVTITKNGKNKDKAKATSLQAGAKSYTINFELSTLRTVFNHAVKQSDLEKNPLDQVKFLKVEDSRERRFLNENEEERFLGACEPEFYPIFFMLLKTGMRKGELENLEWSDIDFQRKTIKIRKKDFWKPKTGEREIPMSNEVERVLNNVTKQSRFIFPDKNGDRIHSNLLRSNLARIARTASIYDFTSVHALRHTFASRLIARNVDLPTVQKLMGHSMIETTMIYSHQTPDHLRDAMEKLSLGSKQFIS